MQCKEWDDANSELFKESHDEAVHKNSYKSRLYDLISASLASRTEILHFVQNDAPAGRLLCVGQRKPDVISTAAQRSGEISVLYGTDSTVAGDLSTQSFNSAETHLPSHRHDAPLEMTVGGGQQWRHFLLREQKGAPKCSFQIPIFSLYAFARPEARHSLQ